MFRMKGDTRQALMTLVLAVGLAGYSLPHAGRTATTVAGNAAARTGVDPEDSTAVVQVVARFHQALKEADSAAAMALLAEDVAILESGDAETHDEYRAHHLAADIAFTREVPGQTGSRRVVVQSDAAWVSSTGVAQGKYRGRQVSAITAELMVLSRRDQGWIIRAIHWSSRSRSTQ